MPGYKETIFSDDPVAFWTFDEDRTATHGNQILDEINSNANPLVINGDKYDLEQLSLNDLEVSDQFSIKLAKDGATDNDWVDYNTYFECVNSSAFAFTTEFSIEFLYYKARPDNIRDFGNVGYAQNITSPIINKGTMIDIRVIDFWGGGDGLYATMFGTRSVVLEHASYPVFTTTNHVILTYQVVQTDVNEYTSYIRLYVNGRLRDTNTANHVDTYPNVNVPDSWLVAGNGGSSQIASFNTELLTLDQMSVYDVALSEAQISNHYRKTKHYEEIIKDDGPQHYWRMDELDDPLDYNLYADVGGIDGYYYGEANVNRHETGPPKLVESRAAEFNVHSTAVIGSYAGTSPNRVISVNQNYTLEFWFKSNDTQRGTLFSCIEENPDWDGLIVWLNSKDNIHSPGNIQISENLGNYVNSLDLDPITGERNNWNDDVWHYVIIRRDGNDLQLWIDGVMDNNETFAKVYNDRPSQIHLMGMAPGEQNINGQISEIAFYQYTMQEIQIMHRWLFTTRYRVSGFTLLQGQPIQATVRFYDHVTGTLLDEVATDSITGEYDYQPATNRFVDILSFIPDNNTTRYRVHGPVKPAEFDDSHLI